MIPMSKEIEISTKLDGNELLSALKQAKLKAKLKGDSIVLKNGLFSRHYYNGTIMNCDGEWTGSIVLTGTAKAVTKTYAVLIVALKKFLKAK